MSTQYRDPWAKREAWRKSTIFSNRAMFRNLFPGFGIAVVAFTAYVAYDNMTHPESIEAIKDHAKEHAEGQSIVSLLKDGKH
ncbi:hypothetical protein RQP46_001628 [Phenoliferia psychrophenolica]